MNAVTAESLTDLIAVRQEMGKPAIDRDEAIKAIRVALKRRSGKSWSVTGGRGTAWGWINIDAPPKRRTFDFDGNPSDSAYGVMGMQDRQELGLLLGLDRPAHPQGVSVAASTGHRVEYVARAEGRDPSTYGVQYWD